MDYRTDGAATHYGKGLVTGVDGLSGVEQIGSTIQSVSDSAAAGLTIRAKGTGTLQLGDSSNTIIVGASTSGFGGMNRGQTTLTLVALPISGIVYSTLSIPGLGVNDLLYIERPGSSAMSTALGMVGYSCTTAGQAQIAFLNNLASTQSIAADTPVKWAYIKA